MAFQDEGRFGLKPHTGRMWSQRGERTPIPTRPGYKNFYVNAAVIPSIGRLYQEQQERMNTESFQGFLDRLSASWGNMDVLLVLDRAGWHRAKRLAWPENIRPVFLPPYSPELNPAERLWLRSKADVLKNKVFEDIDIQKHMVEAWFTRQKTESVQKLCACHYLV